MLRRVVPRQHGDTVVSGTASHKFCDCRQVYQLVSDTAFEERRNVPDHPNVDYDLKNLDKPRLETVINASAGEAYCRDHYLSSTGAALPRPGTSTVGGGKEANGVLVGTP